tara:strand:- start:65 stop:613 length:549 start_codon:yes stop_codon:yes gene_type:complete
MKLINTKIKDLLLIKPDLYKDTRGFFFERYNQKKYSRILKKKFVQDNHSKSSKNVLRGLHLQTKPFEQGKLVSVIKGKILDIAVDLRFDSKTFCKHQKFILSASNMYQLWIPEGFAHGFLSLEKNTEVIYKTTNYYSKKNDITVKWDDSDLNINWQIKKPLLSDKDKNGITIKKFNELFYRN